MTHHVSSWISPSNISNTNSPKYSSYSSLLTSPLYAVLALSIGSWACLGWICTVLLLHLCVRPLSLVLFRRWSNRIGCAAFIDALAILSVRSPSLILSADSDMPSSSITSIWVCNHVQEQLELDAWFILLLGRVLGFQGSLKTVLGGNVAWLWHRVLEHPSAEEQDKGLLVTLVKSMATSNSTPLHLLLFPERMSALNALWLAKSKACAQREGRPMLRNVLLPHTTGFYSTLESVRSTIQDGSIPVVYDVTLAYPTMSTTSTVTTAQNGFTFSFKTLVHILTGQGVPSEIHIKIKKYDIQEVLQDPSWLDKRFLDKDACLDYFKIHGTFPSSSTSTKRSNRHWTFSSRTFNLETSIVSLLRLSFIPCIMPILLFFSFPLLCLFSWLYLAQISYRLLFQDTVEGDQGTINKNGDDVGKSTTHAITTLNTSNDLNHRMDSSLDPGSQKRDAVITPFVPPTPFASPSNHVSSWFNSSTM